MSKELERIYKIDLILRQRYPPTMKDLQRKLEVSAATIKRDISFMRDRLNAPIVFDRVRNAYCYGGGNFDLPGVWFTQAELSALLVLDRVLQEGPLNKYSRELSQRIHSMLQAGAGVSASLLSTRIRVVNPGLRRCDSVHFEALCNATLLRRQLRLRYFTRSRSARTDRIVSPQQIICYRSNWYFDAWCHRSEGLRRFAVDAIEDLTVLDEPAHEAPPGDLAGYGIFTGAPEQTARLQFDESASRWVSKEVWHPRQALVELPGGRVQLEVPFSHPQEIMMDILRHGAHVEVVAPRSLRTAVAAAHRDAAALYESPRKAMATAFQAAKVS